jgi:hypothetical protein
MLVKFRTSDMSFFIVFLRFSLNTRKEIGYNESATNAIACI